MKLLRKALADPYIYFLLALNLYLIYAFRNDPGNYTTIIWLYWSQSVLIGIFTFLHMLTTKDLDTTALQFKNREVNGIKGKGCFALFFLVHYNIFHLVYMIFLWSDFKVSMIDFPLFKLSLICIFLGQVLLFVQNKWKQPARNVNAGAMFILPYLRIVPMHLMILVPAFLGFNPALIFLVLKTIFDLIGHLLTAGYWKDENNNSTLQSLFFTKPPA